MNGVNLSGRTIKSRMQRSLVQSLTKEINRPYGVPYLFIEEFAQEVYSIQEIVDAKTTKVFVDCDMILTIEDPENSPRSLGEMIVPIIVEQMNSKPKKEYLNLSYIEPSSTNIYDIRKGYLQLDYTVFFPNHE